MLPPRHQKQAKKALWTYWPRRIMGERGLAVLLLIVSLLILIFSIAAPNATQRMRMVLFEGTSGLLSIVSAPAQHLSRMIEHMTGLSNMSSDLTSLREENLRLKQWYNRARQLEAENRSLRELVNLADLPRSNAVTARVIASGGSAFAQDIIVDAGGARGVTESMVAMTGNGVVGRVVSVSNNVAHILLLNDVNARIPVVIENSRHRGVLAGNNNERPQLLYLPEDAAVSVGERVLTSGHGGLFAAGLPVGIVVSTDANNIRVQPFADMRRLDIVQLIDFGQKNPMGAKTADKAVTP